MRAKQIWIVDQDREVQRTIRLFLEKEGWKGIEIADGMTACRRLEREPPDLILYEVQAPRVDGFSFLDRIRAKGLEIPVVMLSGFLDTETLIRIKRDGAYDWLVKPIQRELLVLTVRRGLTYGQLIEEHRRLLAENLQYRQNLDQKLELLKTLAEVIETKDAYTRGHCERVTEVALEIARAMGLSLGQQRDLLLAGILHDVGKIGIPKEILIKAGPLDEREWALIEAHPHLGLNIIRHIGFLGEAREIIAQHHERYDGSGYPRGLKGESIHLGARILAVADAFDAMGSGRPYHRTRDRTAILEEMQKQAGSQFDPRVVEVFLSLFTDQGGTRSA